MKKLLVSFLTISLVVALSMVPAFAAYAPSVTLEVAPTVEKAVVTHEDGVKENLNVRSIHVDTVEKQNETGHTNPLMQEELPWIQLTSVLATKEANVIFNEAYSTDEIDALTNNAFDETTSNLVYMTNEKTNMIYDDMVLSDSLSRFFKSCEPSMDAPIETQVLPGETIDEYGIAGLFDLSANDVARRIIDQHGGIMVDIKLDTVKMDDHIIVMNFHDNKNRPELAEKLRAALDSGIVDSELTDVFHHIQYLPFEIKEDGVISVWFTEFSSVLILQRKVEDIPVAPAACCHCPLCRDGMCICVQLILLLLIMVAILVLDTYNLKKEKKRYKEKFEKALSEKANAVRIATELQNQINNK